MRRGLISELETSFNFFFFFVSWKESIVNNDGADNFCTHEAANW